jgi:hypothetical protein
MYRGTDNKEWVDRASLEYVDDSEVYVNKLSSGRAATMGGFCSKEALFSAGAIIQTPDKAKKAQLLFNVKGKLRVKISQTWIIDTIIRFALLASQPKTN